ncbi:hypothetical protein YC2023_038988 [Brassica napus]
MASEFMASLRISSLGVSLKGNTYWLGSDDEDLKGNSYWLDSDVFNPESEHYLVNFILRFDFTTERFERLSLPSQSDDSEAGEVISHWVLSVVREEKLALLSQNFVYYSPLEMKIWMTNTKADEVKDLSWSKFFFFCHRTFIKNSEIENGPKDGPTHEVHYKDKKT